MTDTLSDLLLGILVGLVPSAGMIAVLGAFGSIVIGEFPGITFFAICALTGALPIATVRLFPKIYEQATWRFMVVAVVTFITLMISDSLNHLRYVDWRFRCHNSDLEACALAGEYWVIRDDPQSAMPLLRRACRGGWFLACLDLLQLDPPKSDHSEICRQLSGFDCSGLPGCDEYCEICTSEFCKP